MGKAGVIPGGWGEGQEMRYVSKWERDDVSGALTRRNTGTSSGEQASH